MSPHPKALVSWSGGKDASLALHRVLQEGCYEPVGLLTTFNARYERVTMHGVRETLIRVQADAIGLPIIPMYMEEGTNEEYERNLWDVLEKKKAEGVHHIIIGDIFLEDLRQYREKQLQQVGMTPVFPLWKESTPRLVEEFLTSGFRAITCCVAEKSLDASFVGRELDQHFIDSLPEDVDPCGEYGEFHTLVYQAPFLTYPLRVTIGEKVRCTYPVGEEEAAFWYCDLLLQD